MEEKIRGLVLNGISYGENDKILSVFTLEKGIITAGIKGVKKAGAKLKFASEPFCFAEFIFSVSGERRTVIGASLIDSFYPLRENIVKYYAGTTVLEYVKKFGREEIISADVFLLAIDTLKDIAYKEGNEKGKVAGFLIKALSFSGYALNTDACCKCGNNIEGKVFFDVYSGGFLCEKYFDGHGREILPETYSAIKSILKGEDVGEFSVNVLKLLDYYISNKTDEKLKSLAELIKL